MKKKPFLVLFSLVALISVSIKIFAADQRCSPGDSNPLCDSKMALNTADPNFCKDTSRPDENNLTPNTFKYSAVIGCKDMGTQIVNCNNWPSLAHTIKISGVTLSCARQLQWCNNWCSQNSRVSNCASDCGKIYSNCKDDTPYFISNCPKP